MEIMIFECVTPDQLKSAFQWWLNDMKKKPFHIISVTQSESMSYGTEGKNEPQFSRCLTLTIIYALTSNLKMIK